MAKHDYKYKSFEMFFLRQRNQELCFFEAGASGKIPTNQIANTKSLKSSFTLILWDSLSFGFAF